MSDSEQRQGRGPAERFFAAMDRLLPVTVGARQRLGGDGIARLEGLFFILALLGTLPALRAELLFPTSWIAQLGGGLNLAGAENPFGLFAFLIAAVVAVQAVLLRRAAHFFAVLPFLLLGAGSLTGGPWQAALQNVYAPAACAVFLYFIVAGRTRSLYFLVYIAGLALAQRFDPLLTWDRIAIFVAVAIVASLLYETGRQN